MDYQKMKVVDLKLIAKKMGVKGYSKLTKGALVRLIIENSPPDQGVERQDAPDHGSENSEPLKLEPVDKRFVLLEKAFGGAYQSCRVEENGEDLQKFYIQQLGVEITVGCDFTKLEHCSQL